MAGAEGGEAGPFRAEEERTRAEFQRRDGDARYRELYSIFNRAQLFVLQGRERALLRLLDEAGIRDLARARILDVGCGGGQELARFLFYGGRQENLVGVELEPSRAAAASRAYPGLTFVQGNAAALPFAGGSFDLVLQFTVFTSILDPDVRRRAAEEMVRVLRQDGHVLWYDFWINPFNRSTRGIGLRELRVLFPGCRVRARRVELASPIARATLRLSWLATSVLDALPFLRTNYLALISRQ